MGTVMAVSGLLSAVLTLFVGRLFNRFGPTPLNRAAALCCATSALLTTQAECLPALAFAWMLTGQTLLLTSTAGYRGVGGLFTEEERVTKFSRMSVFSNLNEILIPIVISTAFTAAPEWTPWGIVFLCVLSLVLPGGISMAQFQAQGQTKSLSLLVNLKRVVKSGPLLAAVTAGAGIHALLCVYDVIIPSAAGEIGITTTQVGFILSSCALAQAAASYVLSARPNPRTLPTQLRNGLLLGAAALSGAVLADGFFPLLLVVVVSGFGFGLIHPLSMSTIFQYSPADSVGDIVGARLMLNNIGRILMPSLMAAAVGIMPPIAFLTMAAMIVLVLTLGTTVWQMVRRKMPA